ncbi:MAG: M48 family metallopeptidase [Deltaproteobacteria bacterium]|nr:M48 family metallopeptidase [Deltaproteobacteria bacterium]
MSAKTHERKRFPKLSIRAIEHPADRAALTTLRKVPGFDIALKKLIGLLGERSLRTIYLASAVRVNERQFGDLFKIYSECIEILDVEEQPELFVSQTPFVNAGAIGTDRPFIVLNSATIALLSNDELRFILGHELGHILSDHVLYKTMLNLLLRMSVVRFGIPLGWLAIFAIIAALNEWDRKSELSADRAGVLCVQDPPTSYGVFMKLSGGASADQMNLDEFIRQAEDYESGGDKLDSVYKILNLIGKRHPFPVLRLAEMKKWVEEGEYENILSGQYEERGKKATAKIYNEFADSAKSYKESLEDSGDPLVKFLRDVGKNVAEKGSEWFQKLRDQMNKEV